MTSLYGPHKEYAVRRFQMFNLDGDQGMSRDMKELQSRPLWRNRLGEMLSASVKKTRWIVEPREGNLSHLTLEGISMGEVRYRNLYEVISEAET